MKFIQRIAAIALSIGVMTAANDAKATILDGSFTGTVTDYAGPPGGLTQGQSVSGTFSFDSSLPQPWVASGSGSTFAFSYTSYGGSFTATSLTPSSFTIGSGGYDFVPAPHFFLDLSFSNPGTSTFALSGANIGSGNEAFGGGQYFFTLNSISVSPVSAVPLPATLPLFGSAIAILGVFLRWRRMLPRSEPTFV